MSLRRSLMGAFLTMLALEAAAMVPAFAQSVNSTSTSSASSAAINGVNFDFGSAAVATLVIVILGLVALLVILAKYAGRARSANQ